MTAEVLAGTAASQPVCALHGFHVPKPLTIEAHHVIPVGWQLHWQPSVAPFPGVDQDGRGKLWDARTIWVPPTCHRNVHWWIVKLMHAVNATASDDPLVAYKAVRPAPRAPKEFACAYDALTRFTAAGGSLLGLVAAREWGMA